MTLLTVFEWINAFRHKLFNESIEIANTTKTPILKTMEEKAGAETVTSETYTANSKTIEMVKKWVLFKNLVISVMFIFNPQNKRKVAWIKH